MHCIYCNIPNLFIHTLEYLPKTLVQWHRHRCFYCFNSLSPISTFDMDTVPGLKFNIHLLFIMNLFICEFSFDAIVIRGIHGLLISFLCGFVFLFIFFSFSFFLAWFYFHIYIKFTLSFISFNDGMKFAHRCLATVYIFMPFIMLLHANLLSILPLHGLYFIFFIFFSLLFYRVFISSNKKNIFFSKQSTNQKAFESETPEWNDTNNDNIQRKQINKFCTFEFIHIEMLFVSNNWNNLCNIEKTMGSSCEKCEKTEK